MLKFGKIVSERALSQELGMSRSTLRKIHEGDESVKVKTLRHHAVHFERELQVLSFPQNSIPRDSVFSISLKIIEDGDESWKIHLMNMIDEYRAFFDERLFVLPPHRDLKESTSALLAGTVIELCEKSKIHPPSWALTCKPLDKPWFVAGIENLKASALIESPLGFRMKNIFVLDNFLGRA